MSARDYRTVAEATVYDTTGRITGFKRQAIGFTEDEQARGERIMLGAGGWSPQAHLATRYVDLSGTEPVIRERPVLAQTFDRVTMPVREEAVLADVPACLVAFTGPVSGTHDHPGGDLVVGFTVPGVYSLAIEPFPAMPIAFELTVTP